VPGRVVLNSLNAMKNLLLLSIFSVAALFAEDTALLPRPSLNPPSRAKTVWKVSLASLAVANAMDVQSSWGKHELNGNLSGPTGNFGTQGALLKLGMQGGLFGIEYLITRGHPTGKMYRVLSIVNFGAAATTGAVAAHNYTIGQPIGQTIGR
jgi:hypothetical protein